MRLAPAAVLAALLTSACGASLMKLPAGSGVAAPDAGGALAEATRICRNVTTLTAEIAVSGSVNGQRVRARLIAGVGAPSSARLEAYAFGQPLFTFVATGPDGTLLLERENEILEHAPPEDILEALTGVALDPIALRTTLTGCTLLADSAEAYRIDDDWRVIPDGGGAVYLRRTSRSAPWRVVAATRRDRAGVPWQAEYRDVANGLPRDIRLVSTDRKRFNLHLELSQVETNAPIDPRAFVAPAAASAERISLGDLQRRGLFGGAAGGSDGR